MPLLYKSLKTFLKLLLLLALLYGIGRLVVVTWDSRLSGERAPYVQSVGHSSAVIHWMTDEHQLGVAHYGPDPEHMDKVVIEGSASKNHIIQLNGLKADTRYYYQVGQLSGFQPFDKSIHWFHTAPEQAVPTRIWVIGDSGKAGELQSRVKQAALDWMRQHPLVEDPQGTRPLINIWLALGDIAYRSGSNKQFQKNLFEPYGDLLANTSLWPVYGNHDDRRWTYFRIFDLPQHGEAGGVASFSENYYSLDYGNVHVVVLDSQASDRDRDGDMLQWLQKDLAAYRADKSTQWLIAAFHHPPYSKGSHDSDSRRDSHGRMQEMRENALPLLEAAGVDLVLSGHSHLYERSHLIDCAYGDSKAFSEANVVSHGQAGEHKAYRKLAANSSHQGAIYIVSGSAAKVDNGDLNHPAHAVGLREAGSVVIDIDGNTLDARFIDDQGEVRDAFRIVKEVGYESGYGGCDISH